jgi:hypothetical protein
MSNSEDPKTFESSSMAEPQAKVLDIKFGHVKPCQKCEAQFRELSRDVDDNK